MVELGGDPQADGGGGGRGRILDGRPLVADRG